MSLTVTFHNIDNPQRSVADLQLFLIFCHLSGNGSRTRSQTAYMKAIDYLDNYVGGAGKTPLEIVQKIIDDGNLETFLKKGFGASRVASARRFFQSFAAAEIDLRSVDRDELSRKIKGIGPAKASMFVFFRDRNWQGAAVDRPIQRWMRDEFNALGLADKAREISLAAPKSLCEYRRMEQAFLELARKKNADPRQLNFEIIRNLQRETRFDKADARRIENGGKRFASHWKSRPSRDDTPFIA